MWHPNDLVDDTDLTAYETEVLTQFAQTDWAEKRSMAIEDWLGPILRTRGFALERLRTRFEADTVWGYTGSVYTDHTGVVTDATPDDLNLATLFATPANDALFIGSTQPFRGLSIRMLDAVSSAAGVLSVACWADEWKALGVIDGTTKTGSKTFSGGGSVLWRVPSTWVKRAINESAPRYFVKVTVNAVPAGASIGQIGVIRRSSFCPAVAFRTLQLIMREAPTGGPGPWAAKAEWYETEADAALQRALVICGGEFETDDPATDLISPTEAAQAAGEVAHGFRLERG